MKIEINETKKDKEPVLLKNVGNGEIVRFHYNSFEEAIKEDLFYYVLSNKDKRVRLICLANAEEIERDEDWRVFKHEGKMLVSP